MKFQARKIPLKVVALFPASPALPGEYVVTPDVLERGRARAARRDGDGDQEPGADTDTVRAEIEDVIGDLPTVTVKDPEGFAAEQQEQVNQFLYLIYGLLGLAVIIAILGVVNTLGLSVIERTREVGLLRAVGVSRRQLRTMIRLESIVVAVLGGVLGTADGRGLRGRPGDRAQGRGADRPRDPVALARGFPAPRGRRRRARSRPPGPARGQAGRPAGHRDRVNSVETSP